MIMNNKLVEIETILQKKYYKARITGIILIVVLLMTIFISIGMGKADIGVIEIIKIAAGKLTSNSSLFAGINEGQVSIIWNIRFPRILTAVIVGTGLAVSGAIFQSLLMNPLADSYTMGVSSGAAFGATVAIYLNMFILDFTLPVTLCAFVGAFLTLAIVTTIASNLVISQ